MQPGMKQWAEPISVITPKQPHTKAGESDYELMQLRGLRAPPPVDGWLLAGHVARLQVHDHWRVPLPQSSAKIW